MHNKEIDSRGLPCPQPVLNTKKALEEMSSDAGRNFCLKVLVDNETARENVIRFVRNQGYQASTDEDGSCCIITIFPESNNEDQIENENTVASPAVKHVKSKNIFLFKSSKLGEGSDELGSLLMRGFIFTIKETIPLPEKMLFMNSSVYLTTTGSPVLEELIELEKMGIVILSCGTCLDYYQLKDKLEVGQVTNMYDTLESITDADKCITI